MTRDHDVALAPKPGVGSSELLKLWTRQLIAAEFYGTRAGALWLVLQPALMALVFTVAFSAFARITTTDVPYAPNFLVGYVPWVYFVGVVNRGSRAVVSNTNLMAHFRFPRYIVVASIVISALVELLVGFACIAVLLAVYQILPTWRVVLIIPILGSYVLLAAGVAFFLAAATATHRDVANALQPVIRAGFYLSPIIYSIETIPEQYLPGYMMNPIAGLTVALRDSLFRDELREPMALMVAVGWSAAVFVAGFTYFDRSKYKFADIR